MSAVLDQARTVDKDTKKKSIGFLVSLFPGLLIFLACLVVYARTAAPSVMGGDSAEFQMAAPLLGVPHPTTYPLYILLGKLFTVLLPFGDLARRVTLVSAFGAAAAVALLFVLARRQTRSALGGALATIALAVTPGLWNAATMAEVYGLLAALLVATWLSAEALERTRNAQENRTRLWRYAALAAFLAGLGVSHHGLFVFTFLPVVGIVLLRYCFMPHNGQATTNKVRIHRFAVCAVAFALGLSPWLFPLVQYARFGPFTGEDYGFPKHYFWGSPTSWADALGMISGGPMRGGVFRLPTWSEAGAVLRLLTERMWFEFGPVGVPLGVLGLAVLLRRNWRSWLMGGWIACGTLVYLLLLGPAVQDAPIFTMPLLLPWALWVGVGGHACASLFQPEDTKTRRPEKKPLLVFVSSCFLALLLAATLAWGYTRLPYANKRHLNIWREWGQATLTKLPPNAVVIAHWEQGMVLQYLVQAEQQRLDVWVDVVEPADDPWGPRAERRYPHRPVFFVGAQSDVSAIPTKLVLADPYADLFQWHGHNQP